jgi:hypothetical protein
MNQSWEPIMDRIKDAVRHRYDRMCDKLANNRRKDVPWAVEHRRGALDLSRDQSEHRKYHALFEDLQN